MTIRGLRRDSVAQLTAVLTAALLAAGSPAAWADPAASARPATALDVQSEPAGATVYVDGQLQGVTPVAVEGIASGEHTVRIVKDGFLENSRVVSVPATGRTLRVALTPTRITSRAAMTQDEPGEPTESGGGGGGRKWILIGGAALLAGGTALCLTTFCKDNQAPTVAAVTASPSLALQGATSVSFTASASDKEGKPLTYNWDFGDGSTGSGASASHVYQTAGSFGVSVVVSDGENGTTGSTQVQVVSLAGVWSGRLTSCSGCDYLATFTLAQNGATVTGTFRDRWSGSETNGSGAVAGGVSAPRGVQLRNSIPGVRTGVWTGTLSEDGQTISGSVDWWIERAYTFLLTRQ